MSFGAFATSPRARGRVLVHVVELDDGDEVRLRAHADARAFQRGDRVRLHSKGDGVEPRMELHKGRPSRRAGTYLGTWWVKP